MGEMLSKSTQSLVQNPQVREAVHTLLNRGDQPVQPSSVTVTTGGKQVELTTPPAEG